MVQPLRPWQKSVRNLLRCQDDRRILWICDTEGNTGKTYLGNYLMCEGAYVIEGGSTKDIAFSYQGQEYVVIDLCRSQEQYVNYHVMECFKNGRLFSPKYESRVKQFNPVKVIVFSNFFPEWTKLSLDRWECLEIVNDKLKIRYPCEV